MGIKLYSCHVRLFIHCLREIVCSPCFQYLRAICSDLFWTIFNCFLKYWYLTFSMLSVSCKLLTRKCAGNPWIPSAGIVTAFLQLGQTITLGLLVLSLLLALAHLSKHSSQNEWRQGSPRGFLKGSKQMPQCIKFWVIFSAKELAILPLSYIIDLLHVHVSSMGWATFSWTLNMTLFAVYEKTKIDCMMTLNLCHGWVFCMCI